MAQYKLVSFDMDGTLLNSQHAISLRSQQMLRHLYSKGVHIVLASGRPYTALRRLLKKLPMFCGSEALPLSSSHQTRFLCAGSNGANIFDEDQKRLHSTVIDPRICAALFNLFPSDPFVNLNVMYNVTEKKRAMPGYVNVSDREGDLAQDEWLCLRRDEFEEDLYAQEGYRPQLTPLESFDTEDVNSIVFACHDAGRRQAVGTAILNCVAEAERKAEISGLVKVATSAPHAFDILPFATNKAVALRRIAEMLSLELSECVAFGDAMNDAEVLKAVGKGFVMGNADPRLKECLPELEVIGSNDEDAVAATCERLFNL